MSAPTYGSQSMVAPLKRVVVRAPSTDFSEADLATWHYHGQPDLDAAQTEHAALVAWAQAEEKAGRLKPHTMGRWAKGDTTVTPTELAQRPSSAGRPPASARSLLGLYRQGKPRPCPPCQPDSRPPPGCHCP